MGKHSLCNIFIHKAFASNCNICKGVCKYSERACKKLGTLFVNELLGSESIRKDLLMFPKHSERACKKLGTLFVNEL